MWRWDMQLPVEVRGPMGGPVELIDARGELVASLPGPGWEARTLARELAHRVSVYDTLVAALWQAADELSEHVAMHNDGGGEHCPDTLVRALGAIDQALAAADAMYRQDL